jgi:hypothetical protein
MYLDRQGVNPLTCYTGFNITLALRIRPLTQKDRTQPRFANVNDDDCLKVMGNTVRVVPHNKLFTFDHVFGPTTQQHEIFSTLGEGLVHKFIEGKHSPFSFIVWCVGYNVTVLAYVRMEYTDLS